MNRTHGTLEITLCWKAIGKQNQITKAIGKQSHLSGQGYWETKSLIMTDHIALQGFGETKSFIRTDHEGHWETESLHDHDRSHSASRLWENKVIYQDKSFIRTDHEGH